MVIGGCPYKENQKSGTSETGPSTTPSQVSTNRAAGNLTINTPTLIANRAVVTNGSGKLATSAVTATELGYLDGVTSRIQTQLNNITGDISDIQSTLEGLSGGGGTYITSGFSAYNGHSAIGFGNDGFGIGTITSSGAISGTYMKTSDITTGSHTHWTRVTSLGADAQSRPANVVISLSSETTSFTPIAAIVF